MRRLRHRLLLAAAVIAHAHPCAAATADSPSSVLPDPAVLSAGLTAIRQRSLLDLPIATLALEGLKGLSAIDPAIAVGLDGNAHLLVLDGTRRLAVLTRPADDDSAGWAAVIRMAAEAAAPVSSAIRQADQERLEQAFFDAALGRLDVFSHFAGAVEARAHRAERDGFGGIGVLYEPSEDGIVLTTVIPGTPAAAAGLRRGDQITAIDGVDIAGIERGAIAERLRGPPDSPVLIAVRHGSGQAANLLTLRRTHVVAPTVTTSVSGRIATMAVTSFNQDTASTLRAALLRLHRRGNLKKLILDLRGNPGGLLDQGVAVADQFIAAGTILTTRGRHPDSQKTIGARAGDPGESWQLVVLVDGHTASAAEMVSAALQDSGRAVIVGTNTFGKGTVQTVVRLPDGDELTVTWSRFFAPSGYALHGLGVLPTLCTAGAPSGADAILQRLRDGRGTLSTSFAGWRSVGLEDKERRQKLRALCPSEDHADQTIDVVLARRLLADPDLYARALTLATTPRAGTGK